MDVVLKVVRLRDDVELPSYAHRGDAGLDLAASEGRSVAPNERVAVPTGLAVQIPDGWVGLVHPRSGLSLDKGLTVVNAPGTVDSGFRGELQVLLVNLSDQPVDIVAGDRVAQLLLQPVGRAKVIEVDELTPSLRGDGGFGSTGT